MGNGDIYAHCRDHNSDGACTMYVPFQEGGKSMTQWEYKKLYISRHGDVTEKVWSCGSYAEHQWISLNSLGEAGWNLIGTHPGPGDWYVAIFKRPKQPVLGNADEVERSGADTLHVPNGQTTIDAKTPDERRLEITVAMDGTTMMYQSLGVQAVPDFGAVAEEICNALRRRGWKT